MGNGKGLIFWGLVGLSPVIGVLLIPQGIDTLESLVIYSRAERAREASHESPPPISDRRVRASESASPSSSEMPPIPKEFFEEGPKVDLKEAQEKALRIEASRIWQLAVEKARAYIEHRSPAWEALGEDGIKGIDLADLGGELWAVEYSGDGWYRKEIVPKTHALWKLYETWNILQSEPSS